MDLVLEFSAYALIVLGALVFVAMFVGRWIRKIGPSTQEREAIGDGICKDGVHPDECPSCRPLPPPCPAVVAGDDLEWQRDLVKIYADYEAYRTELRLPGERAS